MSSRNALSKNYMNKRNNVLHKLNSAFIEKGSVSKPLTLNPKTIGLGILSFIIIIAVIILFSRIMNYINKKCDNKKSFISYLFKLSDNDPCNNQNPEENTSNIDLNSNLDENNIMKNDILNNLSKDDIRSEDTIVRPYHGKLVDRLREVDENEVLLLKDPKINLDKKNEVFHIANQKYTYDQSRCKCAAYGAKLATKADLINAYNNGANWCTYGWTEDQSAFYPVQKCEWDKMMAENRRYGPNQKNNRKYCGYPGLNGGYFANKDLRFGVNCYGIKPKNVMVRPKSATCSLEDTCKLNINYDASRVLNTDEII